MSETLIAPAPEERALVQILTARHVSKEELEQARMMELCRRPKSVQAKALTSHILRLTLEHEALHHPRRQKWREADLKAFEQGLGAFLADLLIQATNQASGGTAFRSSSKKEFSSTLCSSRHFERLVTFWSEMEWVEVYPGFRLCGDFDGEPTVEMAKARRLRATPDLLRIAAEHGIAPEEAGGHFVKDHQGSFPIEVKTKSVPGKRGQKQSMKMTPPQSPKLNTELAQIRDINVFLEGHSFSLEEVPQLKRIFHNGDDPAFDYNMGGRLYCTAHGTGYQRFSKEERLNIQIDGEQIAEVDVSNSFLTIAHWSEDASFDPSNDLYAVEGIERDVVKKIVVARLGSDDWPKRWPKGFKDEYRRKTGWELNRRYKLKNVVETVKASIPVLNRIDQKRNGWAQLQYWESEAIIGAIMELKNVHGVVALPIHDSLVVPSSKIGLTMAALAKSYRAHFGFTPSMKVRGHGIT